MEYHIEGKMYEVSYRVYCVWRLILSLQCMETYILGTMYGDSYKEYNVWRLI